VRGPEARVQPRGGAERREGVRGPAGAVERAAEGVLHHRAAGVGGGDAAEEGGGGGGPARIHQSAGEVEADGGREVQRGDLARRRRRRCRRRHRRSGPLLQTAPEEAKGVAVGQYGVAGPTDGGVCKAEVAEVGCSLAAVGGDGGLVG
jgi:hypothetical protein